LRSRTALGIAFVASGAAGLTYEVLWSRYLALFVGHSAYAQVLVLAVYLGGMALGARVVADLSKRVRHPLRWYAAAEAVLALFGLSFHALFRAATSLSYDVLFPAIGSPGLVGAVRWGLAGLLVLPPAAVLGATFPLMAAALVRAVPKRPGHGVAVAYLLNTLGGAAGVLLAGFWAIGALGLPGTGAAAASLNLLAAALALRARLAPTVEEPAAPAGAVTDSPASAVSPAPPPLEWNAPLGAVVPLLLAVSFGTALASFAYEIAWIRMLSLALGSATHSFELMLSGFILGLAGGAWWIRDRADRWRDPLRGIGGIQVLMGLAAISSLPLFYGVAFDATAWLVRTLSEREGGYALFNLGRYGLGLLVMLPATLLAGMTLPVITGTLLRAGAGESAIGRVYAANTIGSVAGAGVAGLTLLPWLGLEGLILAAAALDVLLGLLLLERSARWAGGRLRLVGAAGLGAALLIVTVGVTVSFDPVVMGSGVFRRGERPNDTDRIGLFYRDGRTATVSAHLVRSQGLVVLASNGKPDASLELRWLAEGRDTLPDRPIADGSDFTTQALAPMLALAHRPRARSAANIGHGSGMTATALLTSPTLQRLVTIEIEPVMVEGSMVFRPVIEPAISDPRSVFAIDDAKSYFAYRRERFDVVFAEPSNPWVSGTSGLFTIEFYRRVREAVAEEGVLVQWIHTYELTDELFLTVVAALDAVFPSYRAYVVGGGDVAIVASPHGPLQEPDWSVLASEGFAGLAAGAPPFHAHHMESLLLFDETTLRPVLEQGVRANSDYHPILDLGAERARFERASASGVSGLATSRVDLPRLLRGDTIGPRPARAVPAHGLVPAVLWGRGAWLREAWANGGGIAPAEFPAWQSSLLQLEQLVRMMRSDTPIASWSPWAAAFGRVEADLHRGTVGWVDGPFYREVYAFLDGSDAPAPARAAVDLMHGLGTLEWERVAAAADLLVARVAAGEQWVSAGTLLDTAVLAYLRVGRPAAARNALNQLGRVSGLSADNLRMGLLDALVTQAGA
jgi:spermidine synthase